MDRYKEAEASGQVIVASINGTFYSSRGMLGSAVSDGSIPLYPKQIPGSLSRCFVSAFRDVKLKQKWYIGETSLRGSKLLGDEFKEKAWINVDKIYGRIDQLLGGGGWIIQRRKDVHRESYERQRFLFRKEDQNSRHTVIAQDVDRNLFLLVFETGHTLHQIARKLTREKVFGDITEAIFLDGGSSSTIVLKGKYLVPPLYLMDKARFSSIQVIIPEERL
jgi:hypothetical protein